MGAPWIGIDLDGTLAYYTEFKGPTVIGEPLPRMVAQVKSWLTYGKWVGDQLVRDFKIFTARVAKPEPERNQAVRAITAWCVAAFGQALPITCVKDQDMVELHDDRAVQYVTNTGVTVQQAMLEEMLR